MILKETRSYKLKINVLKWKKEVIRSRIIGKIRGRIENMYTEEVKTLVEEKIKTYATEISQMRHTRPSEIGSTTKYQHIYK